MYNSKFIKLIMISVLKLNNLWRASLIGRALKAMANAIRNAFRNSVIGKFLKSDNNIYKYSIFYKVLILLQNLLKKILTIFQKVNAKVIKKSETNMALKAYTGIEGMLRLIYKIFIFTGIGLLLYDGFLSANAYIMIILGIIGLLISGHEIAIFNNSIAIKPFTAVFKTDGGENKWW